MADILIAARNLRVPEPPAFPSLYLPGTPRLFHNSHTPNIIIGVFEHHSPCFPCDVLIFALAFTAVRVSGAYAESIENARETRRNQGCHTPTHGG